MTQFSEDELEAPYWINEGFIKNILETNENNNEIEIENMVITPGTNRGDHFASIMFRTKINYKIISTGEKKYQSLIIKTMPVKEGTKKDILESKSFFETEIGMYTDVLPKVEEMLKEIGDNTKLCARVFYCSLIPNKCIIFEDLREMGYIDCSNCTVEEVMSSLTKLAKYHAVTSKILIEGDKSLMAYKQQMFILTERTKKIFPKSIKLLTNTTKKYNSLQKYTSYMEKLDEHFVEVALSLVDPKCVESIPNMLVLTHGDFHKKNMMVKYNDSVLESLLLLDFQISCYGSIVQDLLYAYFMLFTPEMRSPELKTKFFAYYFETYQETLKTLNYPGHIPTMDEFEKELQKFKTFELFLLVFMLPIGYCLGDCINDMSNFGDPEFQKKVYERPELLNELEHLLQRYIDEGYFERINM